MYFLYFDSRLLVNFKFRVTLKVAQLDTRGICVELQKQKIEKNPKDQTNLNHWSLFVLIPI